MEYILCAANYYNDGRTDHGFQPHNIKIGFITCGHRHHNCIYTFAQIVGFPYTDKAQTIHNTEVQGYLTNTNIFVDRKEALPIAIKANQLRNVSMVEMESMTQLFSEDLW